MKKLLLVSFLVLTLFTVLFAKEWTIMIYMCGDNNLVGAINSDIDEMENAYTDTSNINIVIQVDGMSYKNTKGYSDLDGVTTEVRRYHLNGQGNGANGIIDVYADEKLGELDMASPQTVINFVEWAKENYPADNYAIIMWGHGAGWSKSDIDFRGGISDETNETFLSGASGEFRDALEQSTTIIGEKWKFIGLDMCIMSYMEILWDEYDITEMVIQSEADVPYDGWYYDEWLANLSINPYATLDEIGKWIIDDFAYYYTDIYNTSASITYNIIDENLINNLRNAIYNLSVELIYENGGRDDNNVQSCIDSSLSMSEGTFYEDFKDLWSFCQKIINNPNITQNAKTYAYEIQNYIDELNPYDWQNGFTGSHGLGIYLPDDDIYYIEEAYNSINHNWNIACSAWTAFIYNDMIVNSSTTYITFNFDFSKIEFYVNSNEFDNFDIYRNNTYIGNFNDYFVDRDIRENQNYSYDIYGNKNNQTIFIKTIRINTPISSVNINYVNSNLKLSGVKELAIYNSLGQCVAYYTFENDYNIINVSYIPKGVYYCKINKNDNFKFIKF